MKGRLLLGTLSAGTKGHIEPSGKIAEPKLYNWISLHSVKLWNRKTTYIGFVNGSIYKTVKWVKFVINIKTKTSLDEFEYLTSPQSIAYILF